MWSTPPLAKLKLMVVYIIFFICFKLFYFRTFFGRSLFAFASNESLIVNNLFGYLTCSSYMVTCFKSLGKHKKVQNLIVIKEKIFKLTFKPKIIFFVFSSSIFFPTPKTTKRIPKSDEIKNNHKHHSDQVIRNKNDCTHNKYT